MIHRVLVVEDNLLNRELLCDWLETEGFAVVGAANLDEALAAIEQGPRMPFFSTCSSALKTVSRLPHGFATTRGSAAFLSLPSPHTPWSPISNASCKPAAMLAYPSQSTSARCGQISMHAFEILHGSVKKPLSKTLQP